MNVRRQLFRISRAGRDRATTRTTPLCIAVLAWLLAVLCGAFERPAASLPEARVTLTVLNGGDRERAQPESKRDKAVVDSEEELAAGASFRVVLEARARGPFPGPGQRLRVTLPYYHGYAPASIPQGDRPGSAGYTRITTGPAGASIRFIDPHLAPVVDVTAPAEFDVVFDRPMGAGESLRVVYGDGPEGAAIASELAVSRQAPGYKPFLCRLVDSGGEAGAVLARATPSVRAGPARSLRVIAPTVVRPGQPFRVRVVVLDRFGNRAESFRGVAAISGPGLQGRVPLGEAERGAGLASLLAPPEETILRLGARAGREPTVEGTSNPVLVRRGGDRVFFGDLHVHTGEASWDAYGSLDDVFTYARDTMGLDFVAGTDHDGDISADGFARLCALARHHDSPGQFAAFTGFEWTPARLWGHRSVIFPEPIGVVVPCGSPPSDTPEGLWKAIAPYGGIGIVHHPSSEIVEHHLMDWSRHSDRCEPLVEIFSQWNQSKERFMAMDSETNARGVQAALSLGYRLGIVAGSDSHTAMAGRTGGLAAVRADSLSRDAIWKSLLSRRTWGTTGARIVLDLRCGTIASGQEQEGTTQPVTLNVEVHGTAPVSRLELVKGWPGAPLPLPVAATFDARGREDVQWSWMDPCPLRHAFFYLRVVQADGERAWSSPVWISRTAAPASPAQTETPRSWKAVPIPSNWETGVLERPAARSPTLVSTAGGVMLETPVPTRLFRDPRHRWSYYSVRLSGLMLARGRQYRLSGLLQAAHSCTAVLQTLDGEPRNPGLFAAVALPNDGKEVRFSREFVARQSVSVDLYVFLPGEANRYRLANFSVEVRD